MATKGELYFPINTQITDNTTGTTYVLSKMIGRGAYAQCFLAMAGELPFALKIVRLSDLKSEKVRQKLKTEIEIHSSLNHPNIVRMHSSFRNTDYVFMVLELCERGALDDLLKRNKKLKERYVSKFVVQLVAGLRYMHEDASIVHRDLKLGNVFLDNHLNIKIGDFGLSAVISGSEKRRTVCGTPNYIAPEVLFGKTTGHSFEADIWSLGVIIYTLLVGTPPFQKKKVEEIYKLIERNEYIFPADNTLSSDAIDLITRLLTSNPEDRLTLDEISRHRFLTHRENLAYRVYRNILVERYKIDIIPYEYTIFSIPITSLGGIGYILNSGTAGIYYQDMTNTYIKKNTIVIIKLSMAENKKVFTSEEHLLDNLPQGVDIKYRNIMYFLERYTRYGYSGKENNSNNCANLKINEEIAKQDVFIAKIKKIKDGLLFVMTNNILIFDFNTGIRVVIAKEGELVYAFDDDGPVEFKGALREACIEILKPYCNSR